MCNPFMHMHTNKKYSILMPIYNDDGELERYNVFKARLLIRHASSGKKYLYDVLKIKKETSKSCQAKALPGENSFLDE